MKKFSVALIAATLLGATGLTLANDNQMGGKEYGKDMAKEMDTNSDGMISREEFMRYHESKWQKMNKNSSGQVSTTELQRMHSEKRMEKMEKMENRGDTSPTRDSTTNKDRPSTGY